MSPYKYNTFYFVYITIEFENLVYIKLVMTTHALYFYIKFVYLFIRFLKPDGLMVPSHASISLCPISMKNYHRENIACWSQVCGFDYTPMKVTCTHTPLLTHSLIHSHSTTPSFTLSSTPTHLFNHTLPSPTPSSYFFNSCIHTPSPTPSSTHTPTPTHPFHHPLPHPLTPRSNPN